MPRSVGIVVENNFTGGLVTEATALNFPENAVTDIDNCIITKTGSVIRRGGLNYEPGYVFQNDPLGVLSTTNYLWRIAGGNGDLVILVVQIGAVLFFYRTNAGATSPAKYNQTVDLTPFQVATVSPAQKECQFAVGNGYLFVTNPYMEPIYIEFFPSTTAFVATKIDLEVRDFAILEDGSAVATRPLVLNDTHLYTLLNAGWSMDKINKFNTDVGRYPSKADVFWILKDAYGNFAPGTIVYQKSVNDKVIDVPGEKRADTVFRGNTPAPLGHFYTGAFNVARNQQNNGIPGAPVTSTGARPSNVAFHSGRVFYSGVGGIGYTDKIYFSQTIESPDQFGQCLQVNDPTSENLFNLLATDGGVISIPEAGDIIKMFPMAAALIIFATNGIWAITGSTGIGFSATDYTVSKVSSINVKSATSFVDYEGSPVFWNEEGIFMGATSQTGGVQIQSMTEKNIKAFYQTIPLTSRLYVKGTYNPLDKTITWLYRSVAPTNLLENYSYDRALIYSTQYQGFYKWSFSPPTGSYITGVVTQYGSTLNSTSYDPVSHKDKYLIFQVGAGVTLGEINKNLYRDFNTLTYSSFFTTGYKLRGQAVKQGQTNYLYVYFTKEYGSSLSVQALWDYSTSGSTGRWSSKQVVESGRGDYSYDFRRLKIRGQGKAVQYRFASIGDNPFNIPGWGAVDSTNAAT